MIRSLRSQIGILWFFTSTAFAVQVCPSVSRVGLSDLGYTSYREAGQIRGIAVDIIKELAHRSGCKFEFQWFPRQRLFAELQAGHIDVAMGAFRTPERDLYAFHLPYAYLQYDLILRGTLDHGFTSLSDFVEHGTGRLNITRGLAYDASIEKQLALLMSAGRMEVVNDFATVFSKLEVGRADGTIATASIYGKYMNNNIFKERMVVIPIAEGSPRFTGMYVSRATISVQTRQYFALILKSMVADQLVLKYYSRYIDDATMRRTYKLGLTPLLNSLSALD